ncbi:MAG: Eco57I restriction-modification methylase domain-containing protein [Aggregatilineales bacterium]
MPAPETIAELVKRFRTSADEYRAAHYNEEQVRTDFINPFFAALGWDVDNQKGLSSDLREVIVEDRVRIEAAAKAPDYGFYLGGQRKFFVEAKRPGVPISASGPAFQLRRYAWNARLPLSILTNFAEFAAYDGRVMPASTDRAELARVEWYTFEQYVEQWEQIAARWSRAAVLNGSVEKFAETKPARGLKLIPVDDAFLNEIEGWRELLAKNIVSWKLTLSPRELNYAVQMTIDRIVFLRLCEDRGIEPDGQLLGLLNGGKVYDRLVQLFRRADMRYNSGLFHFEPEKGRLEAPDTFTPHLHIDDEPLIKIIRKLCDNSIYDFSQIPVEVLGHVYERFLGKVIELSGDRDVAVVEKPEVRRAGGVYYTPTYIVEYIVRQTVGALLKDKTPSQARSIRILDPACGSGSFLLGAYQFLLDWYREWYVTDGPNKHTDQVYESAGGLWRLTTAERKRILLDHLYGVDIDSQAVEVTKLSLLLRVLEGESEQSITRQLQMFHARALPDLANNIKCGNSLIGFDAPTGTTDNPFDWKSEFPNVMGAGGFDAVIGNPPYIRIQTMREYDPKGVAYFSDAYKAAAHGNYDIYVVFVERGLGLLNPHGRLGFILPHKFFNAQYGQPVRKLIADGKHLAHVVHFGDQQVFSNATTYTALLFLDKGGSESLHFAKVINLTEWRVTGKTAEGIIPVENVTDADWNFTVGSGAELFERLRKMPIKLGNIAERMAQGIRTSANNVYVLDLISIDGDTIQAYSQSLGKAVELERGITSFFLQGREIKSYRLLPSGKLVIIPYRRQEGQTELIDQQTLQRDFPKTFAYLAQNRRYLEERKHGRMRNSNWYAYIYPKNIDVMNNQKILVPDIADRASFAFDAGGEYAFTSGYGITLKDGVDISPKYVLGLLNSRVLDGYLKSISTTMRGGFFRYFTQFIEQLPIRVIDFANPGEKAQHDKIVSLVDRMLDLHKKRAAALTPPDQTALDRQIEATDRQIDTAVYALYGLSKDEMALVARGGESIITGMIGK